jgi:hypothetical protein
MWVERREVEFNSFVTATPTSTKTLYWWSSEFLAAVKQSHDTASIITEPGNGNA